MTPASSKLRKVSRYFLSACLLFLLFCSGILWYVTTASFQNMVRGRLIASLERATGGRVELGSFHVTPLRFEVEVRDLTIHGREAAGQVPFMHVDSVSGIVNLSSALGAKLGFHSLTLQHPVAHIVLYPDGSTNQPSPKQQGAADFEQLFAFSIDRLNVRQGELLWQDQRIPLDFTSNDMSTSLNYSFFHRRYSGTLATGKAETHFDGYRPVAWAGQAIFAIDRNGIQVSSLEATAGRSRLQASGVVVSFRTSAVKGNYDLVLDLVQAAAVSRQPQLKGGTLAVQGSGSWTQEKFLYTGNFDVRDVAWQDQNFSAKNVSGSGQFSWDPQKISFSRVQGQMFRGSFTSDAEIFNWQAAGKRTTNPREEQRGAIKIRTKDVA